MLVFATLLAGCGGGSSGPPPATTNDAATTNESTPVSIDVLANDVAVTASTLRMASPPGHGTATLASTLFTYNPDAGFSGQDSFTYSVTGNNGTALTGIVNITVNAPPIAAADNFSVVENTPTDLDILANDADSDGSLTGGISIVSPPAGTIALNAASVNYTPPAGFIGDDSFSYRVADNQGAASNTAQVTISIVPITRTTVTVTSLQVPSSGYAYANNAQLGSNLLTSPMQALDIPPNAVSFVLMLRGSSVNQTQGGLFITNLFAPDGTSPGFRNAIFCDVGLCTADVPKRPDIAATPGRWHFTLGTNAANLGNVDFNHVQLQLTTRVGPAPDASAAQPATIAVHPFLTATTVTPAQLQVVLNSLTQLAADNQVSLALDPLTVITDPQYAEVSSDFADPTTAALVTMGDADKVNVFFLDSFTGTNGAGTLGIAPGIPGTLGVKGKFNGVLINATATYGGLTSFYARTTAQFTFHEIGHMLGLFHTTEADFNTHDILDDTPECTSSQDANHNSLPDVSECPDGLNLMFWTNDFSQAKDPLTNDQKMVLFDSVLAVP